MVWEESSHTISFSAPCPIILTGIDLGLTQIVDDQRNLRNLLLARKMLPKVMKFLDDI